MGYPDKVISLLELLFESESNGWLLRQQQDPEKVVFDVGHLKSLKTTNEVYHYLYKFTGAARMENDKFQFKYLGDGSSRAVYDMGNGNVLKVAHSTVKTNTRQNRKEVNVWECTGGSPLLTGVVDYDNSKFLWLVAEKADRTFGEFSKSHEAAQKQTAECLNQMNKSFGLKINKLTSQEQLSYVAELLVHKLVTKKQQPTDREENLDINNMAEEIIKNGINKWTLELIKLMKVCKLDSLDFWCQNMGIKNGKLVFVDYGW